MKPEIEEKIKKRANKFIIISIFISLMPFCFLSNNLVASITVLAFYLLIPIIAFCYWHTMTLTLFVKFSETPYYINLYHLTGLGRSIIRKYLINILTSNKEPIIKKYEYIIFRIYLHHYVIYFRELFPSLIKNYDEVEIKKYNLLVDELAKELCKSKKYTNEHKEDEHFKKLTFDSKIMLTEDELKIAKEAYNQYSQMGLTSYFFKNSNTNFFFLIQLQNYAFSIKDLKIINEYSQYIEKKIARKKYSVRDLDPTSGIDRLLNDVWIINNMEDMPTLDALLKFFSIFVNNIFVSQKELLFMIKSIETKIQYINFQSEITFKNIDAQSISKRINKI